MTRYFANRMFFASLLFALVAVLMAEGMGLFAKQRELSRLRTLGYERLSLYTGSATSAIERFRYLPFILARDRDVISLITSTGAEDHSALADRVNRMLEVTNFEANALALFIMDKTGLTLASSNWREPLSFVGKSYPWRPYFTEAMEEGEGSFFGIGWTSGQPGYFLSRAIEVGGERVGVAVVKINLTPLELDWLSGGEIVAMSDRFGVVFLTGSPELKYKTLHVLDSEQQKQLEASRKYHNVSLEPLDWTRDAAEHASEGYEGVTLALKEKGAPGDGAAPPTRQRFMHQSLLLPDYGWRLHYFTSLKPASAHANNVIIITLAAALVLYLGFLYWRQRRLAIRVKLEAHEELERRVEERTRELVTSNRRLVREIGVRQKAEASLRAAQEDLVQASKLAALGKMSAVIAHEINQPLTAIQTFVSSARLLIRNRKYAALGELVQNISQLADRMADLTRDLKSFARRSDGRKAPVSVRRAIDNALGLMAGRLRQEGVTVRRRLGDDDPVIMGNQIRLEQVLVNVINNAIDAMQGCARKTLTVTLEAAGRNRLKILIADTGAGVAGEHLPYLFDPFFTTKEVGSGLGLGLSISYAIVEQHGGALSARNLSSGGSQFKILLPVQGSSRPPAPARGERAKERV